MTAAAGCSRPHDPPPAVRAKQTACNVRGPTRSLERQTFEVEPQGPGEEVAGLGVAIALRSQLSDRSDPVRRLSNLNPRRILRIGTHVVPLFGRAGFLPCSTRG